MKKILNSNTIKFIAIIAMTIDHIAWLVYPGYDNGIVPVALHIIGRLTCPIMCYFIAEGYHYTKNVNKYTLRLFLFSFLSITFCSLRLISAKRVFLSNKIAIIAM